MWTACCKIKDCQCFSGWDWSSWTLVAPHVEQSLPLRDCGDTVLLVTPRTVWIPSSDTDIVTICPAALTGEGITTHWLKHKSPDARRAYAERKKAEADLDPLPEPEVRLLLGSTCVGLTRMFRVRIQSESDPLGWKDPITKRILASSTITDWTYICYPNRVIYLYMLTSWSLLVHRFYLWFNCACVLWMFWVNIQSESGLLGCKGQRTFLYGAP